MGCYLSSSVRSVEGRLLRGAITVAGAGKWSKEKRKSIFPKGHCAAMETALAPSTKKGFVIFAGSLILGRLCKNGEVPGIHTGALYSLKRVDRIDTRNPSDYH
jgi:hypothetical protein